MQTPTNTYTVYFSGWIEVESTGKTAAADDARTLLCDLLDTMPATCSDDYLITVPYADVELVPAAAKEIER